MTQKKKYYFCFALAISICMTVLIQVFQLYSLPILGILELFMLVNVCMIAVNIFNRKCLNHVGTLIITGSLFLFLLARNTFLFLFSFSIQLIIAAVFLNITPYTRQTEHQVFLMSCLANDNEFNRGL